MRFEVENDPLKKLLEEYGEVSVARNRLEKLIEQAAKKIYGDVPKKLEELKQKIQDSEGRYAQKMHYGDFKIEETIKIPIPENLKRKTRDLVGEEIPFRDPRTNKKITHWEEMTPIRRIRKLELLLREIENESYRQVIIDEINKQMKESKKWL